MENKGLFYCLSIAAVNTLLLVSEFLPEFNTYMELVPLGGRVGAPLVSFTLCLVLTQEIGTRSSARSDSG